MIRMRYERQARKLTQCALAPLVGLKQSIISQIECGRLVPTADELERISEVLNVPPTELLKEVVVLSPPPSSSSTLPSTTAEVVR